LDELYHLHSYSYPNETLPPRVPSRGMYDRLNPVSVTPEIKNEEDDLFTNKEKYRNRIRKLQMSIRPIGNKKVLIILIMIKFSMIICIVH
jgi:hypothetical protein